MINDYSGKILSEAKHRDFIKEAEGGWLLKQAGTNKHRRLRLKLSLALGGMVLALLLIAQQVALYRF